MENCIFCKIISHEIPSNVVYEDDKIIAFKDINPMAPVHTLVVPKCHIQSINEIDDSNSESIQYIFEKLPCIAKLLGVEDNGYRVIINTGDNAGQTVKHLHVHILGGKVLPTKMV